MGPVLARIVRFLPPLPRQAGPTLWKGDVMVWADFLLLGIAIWVVLVGVTVLFFAGAKAQRADEWTGPLAEVIPLRPSVLDADWEPPEFHDVIGDGWVS